MMSDERTFEERLLAVQTELHCPKDRFNSFGKYKYRSAESILEGVKPLLRKHGLLLTLDTRPEVIDGWHYVRADARVSRGADGATVSGYAREDQTKKGMDGAQITGTAASYATKRALGCLFLIDDTADSDSRSPEDNGPAPVDLGDVRAAFKPYCASTGATPAEAMASVCEAVGAADMHSMTQAQADRAAEWLRSATAAPAETYDEDVSF